MPSSTTNSAPISTSSPRKKSAAGRDAAQARRAAKIELGGLEQIKENVLDARAGAFLDSVSTRFSLRSVARFVAPPAFTAISIFTLALGIGATTAIFSVVNAVLLKPLPIRQPNRVVALHDQLSDLGIASHQSLAAPVPRVQSAHRNLRIHSRIQTRVAHTRFDRSALCTFRR